MSVRKNLVGSRRSRRTESVRPEFVKHLSDVRFEDTVSARVFEKELRRVRVKREMDSFWLFLSRGFTIMLGTVMLLVSIGVGSLLGFTLLSVLFSGMMPLKYFVLVSVFCALGILGGLGWFETAMMLLKPGMVLTLKQDKKALFKRKEK